MPPLRHLYWIMSDHNDKLKQLKTSLLWIVVIDCQASLLCWNTLAALPNNYVFWGEEEKKETQKQWKQQADILVSEIVNLKRSIVKGGQMMAL